MNPGEVIEYGIPSVAWSSFKGFHKLIKHFHGHHSFPQQHLLGSSLKVNSECNTPTVGGSPTPTHGNVRNGTTNSRTPPCNRLCDYFIFPLPLLSSKNFCMSCVVGILVAAELELLERVAGPVCASSCVLTEALASSLRGSFADPLHLQLWPLEHEQTGRHWQTAWLWGWPWTVTPYSLEYQQQLALSCRAKGSHPGQAGETGSPSNVTARMMRGSSCWLPSAYWLPWHLAWPPAWPPASSPACLFSLPVSLSP